MRISDWSSDVCSSDLTTRPAYPTPNPRGDGAEHSGHPEHRRLGAAQEGQLQRPDDPPPASAVRTWHDTPDLVRKRPAPTCRSEEHTSELQSLMRISYADFCLKKKPPHTLPHKS